MTSLAVMGKPIEFTVETDFDAPVEAAFAYTADYRNVPNWLYGVQEFVPVGDKDYGLGSVFDGTMHVGLTLTSRIEVDAFEENRLIAFDTVKGFQIRSRWTFTPTGTDTSAVRADVSYELPGGIAGKGVGKVIEPFVKIAIRHTSAGLKHCIEAAHAG